MHWIDWAVVAAYLVWIVHDGLRRTKGSKQVEGYFLAHRSLPWWAVGLSVMATQLSAITLVGTTGQGYQDGMRFVQFYFGLPLAMLILSVTVVPFFHRAKVYTAYEYLEQRFDAKTRALTSFLFVVSRGLSCGVIVAAPAVILSIVLGWNLTLTVLAIGVPTAVYTMFGGVQAVTWTDVKQMAVIVAGLAAAIVVLLVGLPDDVSLPGALHVAGSTGRLDALDFRFTLTETYTFWSGLIGGLFLMLSYFGCDQSQVQRYLTARSIEEGRDSLMMSAYVKIPLQAVVLFTGVLVFVFYVFSPAPMLFNPQHEARVRAEAGAEYAALQARFDEHAAARRGAALAATAARERGDTAAFEAALAEFREHDGEMAAVRKEAASLVSRVSGDARFNDVNYVFPTFITTRMPIGLVGLMIAAIFAAAMSSIAAELNSLSAATVIDFYRRHIKPDANDTHYLRVSRLATGAWGLLACGVAVYATTLGSLIEVVNRFGSFFYGSILGVFVLAIGTRRATGTGAFLGLIAGMASVAHVAFWYPQVSFLWHNLVGVAAVVVVGMMASVLWPPRDRERGGSGGR
ncbi:MAG TPA: sodium:solute symporter [Vicinamibacterales bacterium]|nr:sodium:solute symporter [Vicinamibacterales bacterium]